MTVSRYKLEHFQHRPESVGPLCWEFLQKHFAPPLELESMAGDGSRRKYYRIVQGEQKILAVDFDDRRANDNFFRLSQIFQQHQVPVAKIFAYEQQRFLLVEDLGEKNFAELLQQPELLEQQGDKLSLYRSILPWLRQIYALGPILLKDSQPEVMGESLYRKDMAYFYEHFLHFFQLGRFWNKDCEAAVHAFLAKLSSFKALGFCTRDFQARNIMFKQQTPYFFDFQDGIYGLVSYDLASLLYASAAKLSDEERLFLLEDYYKVLFQNTPDDAWGGFFRANFADYAADPRLFFEEFYLSLLLRRMRSLGTYGKLGFQDGKSYFRKQLKPSLQELIELGSLPYYQDYLPIFSAFRKLYPELAD